MGKEGEGVSTRTPRLGTCICIPVGSAFGDHRNGWSRLRLLEPDAELESQLTCCAVWGRRLTSLGLFPFLSSGASGLVVVLVSKSYVLSACHGGDLAGGPQQGRNTSIANPCYHARSAMAPTQSLVPTGKGAFSPSLWG